MLRRLTIIVTDIQANVHYSIRYGVWDYPTHRHVRHVGYYNSVYYSIRSLYVCKIHAKTENSS